MDERDVAVERHIAELVDHLNATRGWPWQQPGVESSALDDDGRVRRYRATEMGYVDVGPRPGHP